MASEVKITEWTCIHPERLADAHRSSSVMYYATYNEAPEHWEWAQKFLAKPITLETSGTFPTFLKFIGLCSECFDAYQKHKGVAPQAKVVEESTEADLDEKAEIRQRIEAGEAIYLCPGCNEYKDEDDLVPLRECPHCEETYDGNEGRNCPSCNRPFTRKLAEMACPDCLDADALPEIVTPESINA